MSVVLLPQPADTLARWKQALAEGRARLRQAFEARPAPAELLRKHCTLIDRLLREVWQAYDVPADLALIAVGGYGRGLLFPCSDIDILIVLPESADSALQDRLRDLVGAWWDIGLDVGHSVRTVKECVEIASQDLSLIHISEPTR